MSRSVLARSEALSDPSACIKSPSVALANAASEPSSLRLVSSQFGIHQDIHNPLAELLRIETRFCSQPLPLKNSMIKTSHHCVLQRAANPSQKT
eukprot:1228056-Amphidinium_carterae.1